MLNKKICLFIYQNIMENFIDDSDLLNVPEDERKELSACISSASVEIDNDFLSFKNYCEENIKRRQDIIANPNKYQLYYYAEKLETRDQDLECLDIVDLYRTIKRNNKGQECRIEECVPYYDCEKYYKTQREANNDYNLYFAQCYEILKNHYGPDSKIISMCASGKTKLKPNTAGPYKNSFHFVVRGCGYYKSTKYIKKFDKELFDNQVYAVNLGACKKFRMCLSNSYDGFDRYLYPLEVIYDPKTKEYELSPITNPSQELFEQCLISNTKGEKLIDVIDIDELKKLDLQNQNQNNNTNNNSCLSGINESSLLELIKACQLPDKDSGRSDLEWQDWIYLLWAVITVSVNNNLDYYKIIHEFSSWSKKYDKHETDKVIIQARKSSSTKKNLSIGSMFLWAKKRNPELYKAWIEKYMSKYSINVKDNYVFGDFRNYYMNKTFSSYAELIYQISKDINRVFAKILQGEGYYIKKDDTEHNLYNKVNRIYKTINFEIKYLETEEVKPKKENKSILRKTEQPKTEQPKVEQPKTEPEYIEVEKKVSFDYLIDKYINNYYTYVCKPEGAKKQEFNVWRGFQASKVNQVDMNIINPMLEFINNVWAGNNPELYKYILSWLALTIQKPGLPVGAALFVYGQQGTGKNTLTDFLIDYVIGNPISSVCNDINSIVQKHNTGLEGKKLMILNELGSTKDEFKNNFDKMKHLITEKTINIEPKGYHSYTINNISNWILVSNHRDAIYLEQKDRRYCCIGINNTYENNIEYFKQLRQKCFNQTCGDHFYTYLMNYEACDVRIIPETELKNEIINISKPSWHKYLDNIKSNLEDYKNMTADEQLENDIRIFRDRTEIKASEFYNKYVEYCRESGERNIMNLTKFGICIKNNINKIKRPAGIHYDISTIKN